MISLMTEKKAILHNARGGVYSTPETAPMEMSATYMCNIFGGVFGCLLKKSSLKVIIQCQIKQNKSLHKALKK